MRKAQAKQVFALVLAVLMLLGTVLPVAAADVSSGSETSDGYKKKTLSELSETYNSVSYETYKSNLTEHYDVTKALSKVTGKSTSEIEALSLKARKALISENLVAMNKLLRTGDTVSVDVTAYLKDEKSTTAEGLKVESYTDANGVTRTALYVPDTGLVTWPVTVGKSGLYGLRITYCTVSAKKNSVERNFYVNGTVPFSEARTLVMTKNWRTPLEALTAVASVGDMTDPADYAKYCLVAEDGTLYRFATDSSGNELKPAAQVSHEWTTYEFVDSNGMYTQPFEFYFEKGSNTVALKGVREGVYISSVELFTVSDLSSYEEYQAANAGKTVSDSTDTILLQAELPSGTSGYTIYPLYDRSSAVCQPQHPTKILRNTIGADKWESAGQWVEYTFSVEKAGWYSIATCFKQDTKVGLYVSRSLYVDGVIPFEGADAVQFPYGDVWQTQYLGDDENGTYKFYFSEGEHTVRFTVSVGSMGEIVNEIQAILNSLDTTYLEFLKLTGSDPDEYRDYGFTRTMPDTVRNLLIQRDNLKIFKAKLEGNKGVSANTVIFQQLITLLNKMGSDENQIAKNLSEFKSELGTLGEWINAIALQPLEFDYILIQSAEEKLPSPTPNFFQSAWYQIKQFFGSFFTDYNSLGTGSDETDTSVTVEVWIQQGRDEAQITRSIIQNEYTGAVINLKLVAAGTLLPSVLSGTGPDVSLDGVTASGSLQIQVNTTTGAVASSTTAGDVVNYAIRNAVEPMNQFDRAFLDAAGYSTTPTFTDVKTRFNDASMTPLTLYDKTYALPVKQTFPMMFVRTDILADLGETIPETWDELLSLLPVLQYNNMTIGLTNDYTVFLYQMGSQLWADDGMRINMDSNEALAAFEMMCDMFTQYSLPYNYNAANRFRTGEMPIFIQDYEIYYNTLVVFATEISGQWEMAPIPGIYDEDGNLNRVSVSTVTGAVILRGCENKAASWNFLCWYTDKDFQVEYANERVAVVGPAAKTATANLAALGELDWTHDEYQALYEQMQHMVSIDAYPGSYIIFRYANFAFLSAYNDNESPSSSLLSYINTINKEISRKRREFDLETLPSGVTLSEKRLGQASDVIANASDAMKTTYKSVFNAAKEAIADKDAVALKAAADQLSAAVKTNTGVNYADVTIKYTELDSDYEPVWVITSGESTIATDSDNGVLLMLCRYLYDAAAYR